MPHKTSILVLGGGPDSEREVSIKSSTAIANALKALGTYDVRLEIIDTLTLAQLKALPGDVIVPYLHGPWGEGGPLQDLLDADGRPYVGSNARASRAAMDKVATKGVALSHGIITADFWILNPRDRRCPCPLPVIVKPVHEGSTIGLHVCTTHEQYAQAVDAIADEHKRGTHRAYMIEPKIGGDTPGRELTVGVIDGQALPVIEIVPKGGLYDYEAKYTRNDTQYILEGQGLELDDKTIKKVKKASVRLAKALGVRHIARVDFILGHDGTPWMLEINTTPGFTDHSLVPKAAKAMGVEMPQLCEQLVQMALRDRAQR
jgi:D-alanine-D-alanine ligase